MLLSYRTAIALNIGTTKVVFIPQYIVPNFIWYKFFYTSDSENKLCGIVFVERRYTAALLSDLLNQLAKKDPQLSFVKCNFVVGHGTVANSAGDGTHDMSWKKQEKILRKFRSRDFNLLIATSVVEEGLDVPKCNLVVRFDFPKTYQSYIQSKGRARAKQSQYIIFTSSDDDSAVLEVSPMQI